MGGNSKTNWLLRISRKTMRRLFNWIFRRKPPSLGAKCLTVHVMNASVYSRGKERGLR
jgi:hypothetical protein